MRYENTIGNPSSKQHMTTRRRPRRPTRRDDETTERDGHEEQIKQAQDTGERDKKHKKNTSGVRQAQRDALRDEKRDEGRDGA